MLNDAWWRSNKNNSLNQWSWEGNPTLKTTIYSRTRLWKKVTWAKIVSRDWLSAVEMPTTERIQLSLRQYLPALIFVCIATPFVLLHRWVCLYHRSYSFRAIYATVESRPGWTYLTLLWTNFSQRAELILTAKKIPHDLVHVHLKRKSVWYLGVNPRGQVPFIEHKGQRLPESFLIFG